MSGQAVEKPEDTASNADARCDTNSDVSSSYGTQSLMSSKQGREQPEDTVSNGYETSSVVSASSSSQITKGASSSSRKKLLEKGTVHRAYYVNVDDFNTLKSHKSLKQWLKKQIEPYGIKIIDLSSSWSSGLALCALIHRFRPDLIPNFEKLSAENPVENNQLGFSIAEKHLGISSLLNPAEMESPDRLALVTYLSLFYELFHESQPVTIPTAAEHDLKARKPTTSEKSTVSMKESATGEVTSSKKPAATEKHVTVTSTKKVKSTDNSFTSSQIPKSSKLKKPSWFRTRSTSDSKALKPKSTKNDSSPLELTSTPISPRIAEPFQDSSKPISTTATKRNTGSVKRLSAFFEAINKQQLGAEGRPRVLSVINEESQTPTYTSGASKQTATPDKQIASRPLHRGQKNLTRPVVSSYSDLDVAIQEHRKQQERFIEAQIIQREMSQLETQRDELEEDGREIEEALQDMKDTAKEDELMEQWLNLINERSGLEKHVSELTLKMKELELEDRQYEIDKELNEIAQIPYEALTDEELQRFDFLSEQKVKVVMERNEIVEDKKKGFEESTNVGIEDASSETSEEAGSEDGAAGSIPDRTSEQTSTEETPREREASSNSTVPSGHILTREELQVLGALLSRYSDEKLKSIQLSLQEEQEIRDISREEVEKSLRQSGLASMADGLKDDIEKGVINMKHYEAYEQALKGGLSLTLRYLKFLFFGPPRSGKTSTRRRLIKDIVNLSQLGGPSVSTGVAETNDVIIKKLTSEPAAIVGSQWWSMKRSKEGTQLDVYAEGDLGYIAQLFYQLISRGSTILATSSEPIPVQDNNEHVAADPTDLTIVPASASSPTAENMKQDEQSDDETELEELVRLSDTEKSEIDDAFKKLTTILQSDSPEDLKRLLEDLTMINMTDVGGQPAFLDMLPALTIGPALYLLFFRLDQELGKKYPVRFHAADSEHEVTLESSYCIEEVLYQCLASIACFSSQQTAEREAKPQASSRALLFGTYKDRVTESQIFEIENTMEEHFKGTKLHQEGLLLKSLHGKMVTTIDNMFGTDESEMSDIRRNIERIIKGCFPATQIPVSWLMFRIVLHLLSKPIVSLAQCEEIAKQLSMTSPVQEAIWFFHHDIGSLMHYSNIPSIEDTVICNPQVIFDSISKLIIEKFKLENLALKPREVYEFQQKGLFTISHIKHTTTDHPQSNLLELNQLVDVLKHHNIMAEVKQDEEVASSSEPEPKLKFIMPAVMKYASEDELLSPSSTIEAAPSPIFVHFAGGFVPFGVFCAGLAHLIAQLDSMSPRWQLCDDQVMRNKAKFLIDGAFFATLISRPQYIMIHVEQHPKARCKTTLEVICSKVRKAVIQTLETVILNMKYKPYGTLQALIELPFELAFACNLEDSHCDHLMTVTDDDSGHHAKCLKSRVDFDLEDKHLIWFKDKNGTSSSKSSSTTDVQSEYALDEDEQNNDDRPHSEPPSSSSAPNGSAENEEPSSDVQAEGGKPSGYLSPNDLRRVQDTVWKARAKWYNLGLGLDITPDTLDSIELANSGKPDSCFRAMLTKWLREHQRPTWSALAEALRSPSVGLTHLAEEISELEQTKTTT